MEQIQSFYGNHICIWVLFHMWMGCATTLYEEDNLMSGWVIVSDPLLRYCREDGMGSRVRRGDIYFIANLWNKYRAVLHGITFCFRHLRRWFICQKLGSEIALNIPRLICFCVFILEGKNLCVCVFFMSKAIKEYIMIF